MPNAANQPDPGLWPSQVICGVRLKEHKKDERGEVEHLTLYLGFHSVGYDKIEQLS
jgi:hypothetical protein